MQITACTVFNSGAIACVSPPLSHTEPGDEEGLNYTVIMDNAPGPDLDDESLQIGVLPDPGNFKLLDSSYNIGSTNLIRIMVGLKN